MQPKAIASGLVAGASRRVRRQAEACLGLGNLLLEFGEVAGRDRAKAWLLGSLRGTGEDPLIAAEFQGDVEGAGGVDGGGYVLVSVISGYGVLPDRDLYHL
jgi:hypothetical protein